MMVGGRVLLSTTAAKVEANGFKGLEEVKTMDPNLIVVPDHLGQKAFYPVLVTDMTRSYNNNFGAPDDKQARSNHIDGSASDAGTGIMPKGKGGANVGYIDGHVEWHQQNEMGQTHPNAAGDNIGKRQFYYGSNRWYW
jgi:prepilin-type processing-associated H-X9-DG protein